MNEVERITKLLLNKTIKNVIVEKDKDIVYSIKLLFGDNTTVMIEGDCCQNVGYIDVTAK